jgi:transposase-like protein
MTRVKIQGWIQDLLEDEITEFLGREKSKRRATVDAMEGYRNGYGKPRRISMMAGTITVRRPRVRGLEERFESRLLPLFVRRTEQVGDLLPQLYLHGLAQGDFELALCGLLGDGAPLSASSIERLRAKWQLEFEDWSQRRLDDLEVVYAWADGVYVKAGLEDTKAALLVIIGALKDGRKVVLAVASGQRQSKESWAGVLRDLRGSRDAENSSRPTGSFRFRPLRSPSCHLRTPFHFRFLPPPYFYTNFHPPRLSPSLAQRGASV